MDQATPTPSPDAAAVAAPAEPIAAWLRDRDVLCPSCGCNLRGAAAAACPKCGLALDDATLAASTSQRPSMLVQVARWLCVPAAFIAAYLMLSALGGRQPAGCDGGGGCSRVLGSRWSSLFGVPVSAPALLAYLGLFFATFHVQPAATERRRRDAWTAIFVLSLFVLMGAVWFVSIQAFIIGHFCPWCMADHALGITASLLLLIAAPIGRREKLGGGEVSSLRLSWRRVLPLTGAVTAIMLMFIVAQDQYPARTFVAGEFVTDAAGPAKPPGNLTGAAPPVAGKGPAERVWFLPSSNIPVNPDNVVWLALPRVPPPDRQIILWRDRLPHRGNVKAPVVFVAMEDFTCHHCREVHHLMLRAIKRYGDQLGVLILPMPLNNSCNPHIPQTAHQHRHACDLAKLALAVWVADPSKFAEYDDWLFEPADPRTADEALAEAQRLVGKEALQKAIDTGRPQQLIQDATDIYGFAGTGRLPKLLRHSFYVAGVPESDESAWRLFEDSELVGLKPPQKK